MTPEEIEKVIDDFAKKFPDLVKEMDKYDDTLKLLIKSQTDLKVTGIDLDKNLKKLCESVIRARKAFDDIKKGLGDVGSSMQDHSKQIDSLGKTYETQTKTVKQSTDQNKRALADHEAAIRKEITERNNATKSLSESLGQVGGIVMAGFSNAIVSASATALRSGNAYETASGLMTAGVGIANKAVQAGATGIQATGTQMASMGGKFRLAGGLVSALGGAAGAASSALSTLAIAGIGFMMAETQKMITGFQTMSQAGAIYAGGMKAMTETANSAGMTLDQFSKVTSANKEAFAKSGLGVAEGSKKMAAAMKEGGESARLSMYALGMGMEEQAEAYAAVMAQMAGPAGRLNASNKEIADRTEEYASNLKLLSNLTGEDMKAKKAKIEEETNNLAFQQKLNAMGEKERDRLMESMKGMSEVQRKALQERMIYGTIISKDVAVAEANNSGLRKLNEETYAAAKAGNLSVEENTRLQGKHQTEIHDQNQQAVGLAMSRNETARAGAKFMLDADKNSLKFSNERVKAEKEKLEKEKELAKDKSGDKENPGAAELMEAQQKFAVTMQNIAATNLPAFTKALTTTIDTVQKTVDALRSGDAKQSLMDMFDPKLLLEVLAVAFAPALVGGLLSKVSGMFKGGAAKAATGAVTGAATSAASGAAGKAMEGVSAGAEKLGGGVGKGAQTALQGIAQGLKAIASPQVLIGLGALTLAAMGIGKALQWAEPAITSIGATLVKVFQTAAPVVIKLIETIGDVVKTAITTAGKVINDLATTFVNFISSADPTKLAAIGLALVPLGAGLIAFGAGALVATPGLVGLGAGLALLGAALAILPPDSKVLQTLGKNLKQFVSDTPYLEMLAAAPGLAAFSLSMLPLAGAIKILDGTVSTSLLTLGKNLKSFLDDAPYIRMNAAGPGMALFGLGLLPLANAMKSITGVKPESLSELGTALSNFFKAAPMADLKTAAGPMESFGKAIESYKGKAGEGFEKFNKELKSLQQTDAKKLVEVADAMKKIKDSMPEESSWFKRNFGGGTGQIPVGKVEPAKPGTKKEDSKPEVKIESSKREEGKPQIPQEIKKPAKEETAAQGKIIDGLGKVAAKFESGGRADMVSSGKGDLGGKSYGAFQLSSKTGDVDKFLKSSGYGKQFEGMKVGDKDFDDKWKDLGKNDPAFAKAQSAHAQKTHYDPQVEKLKASGMDLSGRGAGVQESIMSTANQYGAKTDVIVKALKDKDVGKMSDKDIINAVQDYKASTIEARFKSSSVQVRAGVAKRIEQERAALLDVKDGSITGLAMSKTDATNKAATEMVKAQIALKDSEEQKLAKKTLDAKFDDIKSAEMKKVDLSKMSEAERVKFVTDLDAKLAKDKAAEATKQGIDSAKEVAKSTIKINGKEKELGAGPSMDDLKKKADERQAVADKAEADAKPKTSQADIRKLDAQMEEKFKADAQIKPDGQTGIQRGSGFNKLGVNVGAENRRNPLNIGGMVNQAADAGAANLTQQKAFYEQQKKAGSESGEAMGPPPPHPELIAALQKMVTNGEKHIELQSVALEHASQMASTMDDNKRYTREIMKSSR